MATEQEVLANYQREKITFGSADTLTLMLYEAALKSVRSTKARVGDPIGDVLAESQRARDIMLALADTVNMSHPYGQTLRDLYLYCWRTTMTAPSQANPAEALSAVETVLMNLTAGLKAFVSGAAKEAPPQETVAPASLNFVG